MNATPATAHQVNQRLAAPRTDRDPLKELQAELKKGESQMAAVLPSHIPPERFTRVLMTAVAKNGDLVVADRQSLFTSCLEAAADGLLPNGKEAALVIFNTKVKQGGRDVWIKKVQYMPMIAGLYKKARNSGEIAMLNAHVVYEKDDFSFSYGFEIDLMHKPLLNEERGKPVAVYAAAVLKDGTRDVEVMSVAEVNRVRNASKSKDGGPWVQWWDEMARKTVMRRLMKRLPLSEELEKAIERDDAYYEMERRREAGPALAAPANDGPAWGAAQTLLEHDNGTTEAQEDQQEAPARQVTHDPETGEIVDDDNYDFGAS